MRIVVKLFATLADSVPGAEAGEPFEVAVRDQAAVSDVMDRLKLPADQAKLIFVNGRMESPDFRLKDGDEVGIFPPIGGG